MSELTVTVTVNGPLKLEGPLSLCDSEGHPIEIKEGKAVYLCRCGASSNKPFCDGTHARVGFDDGSGGA